ncbi:MAG: DUF2924 domain-containing protein [Candidatus Omnitrophota bacterium]
MMLKKQLLARINELIARYDPINNRNSHTTPSSVKGERDNRLPIPGSTIHKEYKGKTYVVRVLRTGFEYEGKRYRSLTAIAKEITGMQWGGFGFFGLNNDKRKR